MATNSKEENMKTLNNTDTNAAHKQVRDIEVFGDGNIFRLISKANSKAEKWMKSTKAMYIENVGCVVQVTTQQGENVAEAVVFVPGTQIETRKDENGKVISRKIIQGDREKWTSK